MHLKIKVTIFKLDSEIQSIFYSKKQEKYRGLLRCIPKKNLFFLFLFLWKQKYLEMEHIEYFQSLNIIYFPNICPFIQYTNLRINCFRNFHNNCSICSVLNRVLLAKIASFLCTKMILRDVCQVQPTVISNCGKPAQTSSKHGFLFVCVLIMARLLNIFFP